MILLILHSYDGFSTKFEVGGENFGLGGKDSDITDQLLFAWFKIIILQPMYCVGDLCRVHVKSKMAGQDY